MQKTNSNLTVNCADNLVTSRDDFDAFNEIKINSDDELVNKI